MARAMTVAGVMSGTSADGVDVAELLIDQAGGLLWAKFTNAEHAASVEFTAV